jgi:phosphopantetheinyl transferase
VAAVALAEAFPGTWPLHALEIASEPGGLPYARLAPEAAPTAGFRPGGRLPVALSISHAGGRALCAAAPSSTTGAACAIGIDLGELEPRSEALQRTFFTEEEQRLVRDAPEGERELRANLVWCAKEAVLKALGVGLAVDTFELTCLPADDPADLAEWPLSPAEGEWHPFAATCRAALLPAGGGIRGVWRTFPGFAAALAIHRRLQPAE